MILRILSPEATIYKGKVDSVTVPGKHGSFQVLENHAPIISTLEKGTVSVMDSHQKERTFEIKGGVAEVLENNVRILVD